MYKKRRKLELDVKFCSTIARRTSGDERSLTRETIILHRNGRTKDDGFLLTREIFLPSSKEQDMITENLGRKSQAMKVCRMTKVLVSWCFEPREYRGTKDERIETDMEDHCPQEETHEMKSWRLTWEMMV